MGNIGPLEIVGLLLLALLLFGARRLPEIGRAVGSGLREFKNAIAGGDEPGEDEPKPTKQTRRKRNAV
jgi:sec-independent protein translocase protein TatA